MASGYLCTVPEQAILLATGDDAASFLHSQLSNDVLKLGEKEARLATYCNAKGRMLASFLMWKSGANIYLQMTQDLLPAMQKRLQMYALRAKIKLSPATELFALGLGGSKAQAALAPWFSGLADLAVGGKLDATESCFGCVLRLADSLGQPRYQWLLAEAQALAVWPQLAAQLTAMPSEMWNLFAIHAGIARIEAATVEKFVPQMVNFELVGGVNFKKGCYPGQEVVARSQYLGKLKRRMYLAHSDASALAAGSEVFSSADPEQACGMVVNAAINPAGGVDALLELKSALINAGSLHVDSHPITLLTLPYALPNEEKTEEKAQEQAPASAEKQ
ncbi:MAG: folate-binding protein YgfZ [Burkholderiales bacterium]|nr:folate-binding protein YgfZ [Burkholderiales bacterium]